MCKRRSFAKEYKLQILRESETEGMLATSRKDEIVFIWFIRDEEILFFNFMSGQYFCKILIKEKLNIGIKGLYGM